AFDRGDNCVEIADAGGRLDAADEAAADIAFVDETVADLEPTRRRKMGQPGRGPSAARAAVNRAFAIENGVAPVGAVARRGIGPENMRHAADRRVERVHGLKAIADRLANLGAEVDQTCSPERIETIVSALRFDDRVKIAAIG